MSIAYSCGKPKERGRLENLSVGGRLTMKWSRRNGRREHGFVLANTTTTFWFYIILEVFNWPSKN
jgi:hypothetical protein